MLTTALALTLGRPAAACQYDECHSDGAVSLASGWTLHLPFEAGEEAVVHAGYGPSGGSSLHCRAQDSSCANDYYALDLTLEAHADHGKGQPVLAVADGEVRDAGWGSEGWANYGRRVYITHEPGDGNTYTSMYAHLDSISVSTGETVRAGQQIGTLGQSCDGADSCGSFSTPHLHFALHRGSSFGGSGSGGSYGGRAVIPEPFDGYTGISPGDTLISDNDGEDDTTGTTTASEDCRVAPSGATIIQEASDCAERTGDSGAMESIDGHGGGALRTAIDVASPH